MFSLVGTCENNIKKKKKVFSRVGTSEKKLFAVEPRKKFSFHVLRWGKKINKINHVSRVSENTVFAAETSKKKYIFIHYKYIFLYIINI